jgi:hypothetical protein
MMHRLTCPVCNPLAKRRRRRFVARVLADGHIEFMHRLAEQSRVDGRQRRARRGGTP